MRSFGFEHPLWLWLLVRFVLIPIEGALICCVCVMPAIAAGMVFPHRKEEGAFFLVFLTTFGLLLRWGVALDRRDIVRESWCYQRGLGPFELRMPSRIVWYGMKCASFIALFFVLNRRPEFLTLVSVVQSRAFFVFIGVTALAVFVQHRCVFGDGVLTIIDTPRNHDEELDDYVPQFALPLLGDEHRGGRPACSARMKDVLEYLRHRYPLLSRLLLAWQVCSLLLIPLGLYALYVRAQMTVPTRHAQDLRERAATWLALGIGAPMFALCFSYIRARWQIRLLHRRSRVPSGVGPHWASTLMCCLFVCVVLTFGLFVESSPHSMGYRSGSYRGVSASTLSDCGLLSCLLMIATLLRAAFLQPRIDHRLAAMERIGSEIVRQRSAQWSCGMTLIR